MTLRQPHWTTDEGDPAKAEPPSPPYGKLAHVRLSVFWTLMNDEFEPGYAASLARDHTVLTLGGRTVDEALEAGIPAREVWDAICEEMDVPADRRFGIEPQPRRRT